MHDRWWCRLRLRWRLRLDLGDVMRGVSLVVRRRTRTRWIRRDDGGFAGAVAASAAASVPAPAALRRESAPRRRCGSDPTGSRLRQAGRDLLVAMLRDEHGSRARPATRPRPINRMMPSRFDRRRGRGTAYGMICCIGAGMCGDGWMLRRLERERRTAVRRRIVRRHLRTSARGFAIEKSGPATTALAASSPQISAASLISSLRALERRLLPTGAAPRSAPLAARATRLPPEIVGLDELAHPLGDRARADVNAFARGDRVEAAAKQRRAREPLVAVALERRQDQADRDRAGTPGCASTAARPRPRGSSAWSRSPCAPRTAATR